MANVYLITGFNNWGKTTLIKGLFGQKRFPKGRPAHYAGTSFCVVPQSNDDLGEARYIKACKERRNAMRTNGHAVTHVLSAFCPTREPNNDSLSIVRQLYTGDSVFLIAVEYKWCGHAKLQLAEIGSYFRSSPNIRLHALSQRNPSRVLTDLRALLTPLL